MHSLFKHIIALFICCAAINAQGEENSPTVKIGAIVPLSGDMSFAGEDIKNGMLLAKELLGQTRFNYELLFEDNALDLKKSVTAAKKLIEIDNADVVVTLWPPTANVVAPITDAANVLHYTIAWDPNIARSHKFVLSHQSMVDAFVKATLKLLKQQGVTKLAFFHLNETGFNMGAELLQKIAPDYQIEVAYLNAFNGGQQDFRTEILKAKSKQADGVLIWAVMPEIEILLKQIRQANFNVPLSGFFDAVTDLSTIEGLPFVSEVHSTEAFASLYKQRFGKDFSLKAPNAFDIVNLLAAAFEQSPEQKLPAQELKARLTKVKGYQGAVGNVSIDEFGNSSYPPMFKVVKSGELISLGPNLPGK